MCYLLLGQMLVLPLAHPSSSRDGLGLLASPCLSAVRMRPRGVESGLLAADGPRAYVEKGVWRVCVDMVCYEGMLRGYVERVC